MDLIDRLAQLSVQALKQQEIIETEEATKNALVMPFINALGYNVFDPSEVIPEFTADVGTKRGEKVDYAIIKDGVPIMLFEVKTLGTPLGDAHTSQLYRYFSVTEARFGILTDGRVYYFYSDLDAPNKMDEKPFLVFDLGDFGPAQVDELKRFSRAAFDIDDILSTASDLKYTRAIRALLAVEFAQPTEEFVRLFAGRVDQRRLTQQVMAEFTGITKRAFRQFINDKIEQRLKTALDKDALATDEHSQVKEGEPEPERDVDLSNGIHTTQDELDAFLVVKAILREVVDVRRVTMRDVMSYCGILLDDNNRRPICRLHFNTAQKYLGLLDEEKQEERVPINDIDDIYEHADRLKAMIAIYEGDE